MSSVGSPAAACLLWLVLAPLRASAGSDAADAIYLQPRGLPAAQCSLRHSPRDGAAVDFWLRGAFSRLLYGCRLDAADLLRKHTLAASRDGRLTLLPEWTVLLNRHGAKQYPEVTAARTPSFACVTDGGGSPTTLPGALFHLAVRRRTAGRVGQWQKCVLVPSSYHTSPFSVATSLVTITFRGGSPTIVCGIGDSSRSAVPPVELKGLLGAPYVCFFATYLDFPGLKGPPAGQVFQRHVLNKWIPKQSDPPADAFLPSECWLVEDSPEKSFDFDVVIDGKHAQRCRFEGECPLCGQDVPTTQPSVFSSTQVSTSRDDTTVSVGTDAKRAHTRTNRTGAKASKPLVFERRLCTYHSLDEKNNTLVHQIPCFG